MQNRTHTCNELRITDIGKTVQLSGWMENIREVGGSLAFIVLRDFYGSTQLVAETEDIMNIFRSLNKESVVSVTGMLFASGGGSFSTVMGVLTGGIHVVLVIVLVIAALILIPGLFVLIFKAVQYFYDLLVDRLILRRYFRHRR